MLALAATACATRPSAVPVAATPQGAAVLAGEWVGSYDFPGQGRTGSLLLRLDAYGDTAHGVAMMLLDDPNARYTAWGGADPWARAPGPTTLFLDITLTADAEGLVRGALAAYEDPLCACTLETRWEGRRQGDRIRGSFFALTPDGDELRGDWEIERMPR